MRSYSPCAETKRSAFISRTTATAITALALSGCATLQSYADPVTQQNVAAHILNLCGYTAPIVEIASLINANSKTLTTATAIAKVVCDTAASVALNTTAPATVRSFIAAPPRALAIVLPQFVDTNGAPITLHLTPVPR